LRAGLLGKKQLSTVREVNLIASRYSGSLLLTVALGVGKQDGAPLAPLQRITSSFGGTFSSPYSTHRFRSQQTTGKKYRADDAMWFKDIANRCQ
jgi:hypothetical protein